MTISIDFNSPVIRIPGYESKYDFAGASNSLIKIFDDYLEARILQQFHFWLFLKKGGVILFGFKWIYKAIVKLMTEAIVGFSEYQVRKAIDALVSKGILIREQLHREHYGAIHARAAYNRQYYYRIDYSTLAQFIQSQIPGSNLQFNPPRHLQATTTETKGFVNTTNQICDLHEPDLRMSQIYSDTTFRVNRSDTPPVSPPNQNPLTREKAQQSEFSNSPDSQTKKQELVDSPDACQNPINSQTTPFADVVARPPRVEQKINKSRVVQKPVQASAIADTGVNPAPEPISQEAVTSDVCSELNTSTPLPTDIAPQKPRSRRHKVPKGTQPQIDFGQAPWTSQGQLRKFVRSLYESNFIKRQAQNRDALINWVLKQLKQGSEHSFWNDFISGLPIGASSQQEWEVEPGIPHPLFIEYLTEKLIKGNNTQTREQAIANALNIAANPRQAIFFWKECKISLGNALAEAERHRALGVQAVPTPLWTKERREPTLEEAAIAGTKIAQIHSSTETALEAAKNRQLGGSTSAEAVLPQAPQIDPKEDDPWRDEVKPSKPKISDFASDKVKAMLSKGSSKKSPSKSEKRYAQPDEWRRQPLRIEDMNEAEINKALTDPILRDELTPQLIFDCDYELITDELGRILRVEEPPEF